jgi:pimeloyl-ACP methyl ester carboxylesterase
MKSINNLYKLAKAVFAFVVIGSILSACSKDKPEIQNEFLLDAQWIATVNTSQVLATASYIPDVYKVVSTKQLKEVKVFKITYKTTDAENGSITASGALLIPQANEAFPLISYQHGTLFNYNDAPSKYLTGMETRVLATIFCSAGYIVSVPDYIGYGDSEHLEHPYEHAKLLASASYDMLMAVKEFIRNNNIPASDKLFLTGYSEGGGATMAMHKYIEENSDIPVTLSAPAAGAYNKTAFAKEILLKNEDLQFLPRFMWVIHAYNRFYKLNRNWSEFVNEPYATTLSAIKHPFNYANAAITLNPQLLFASGIKNGILNGTDSGFLNALADNDIYDWKPKAPVRLYYGTADDYVFPLNSETAYLAMKGHGANVTKIALDGLDHSSAFIPYILDVFNQFELLK